jgi:Cof subfamily protein (haloacid dehalogenase superfamily)
MKTLYISDLDGTLLNSDAELSDYTEKVLNYLIDKGIHFSIATARTAATTLHILEGVNLRIPIVLNNGVLTYDPYHKRYIKKEILSDITVAKIIHAMREAKQTGLMYTLREDKMHTYYETLENPAIRSFVDERVKKYNKVFKQVADFSSVAESVAEDSIYFCFMDEQEGIERMYSLIANIEDIEIEKYLDIYSDYLWYLEIFSDTASKYNAVRFLREYGGYDRIIGFGDNLNDIPLFRACDECYAVANAKDELKEIATAVIEGNDNEGVAKWLEGNVL